MAKTAKERGIKYFLISYVDLFGTMRAKLVPAAAIGDMAKNGAGFAGFASWLDMTPADPDMLAIPDPDSLIQLPWRKEVGWLAADPYMDGKLVEQAPRNVLKRVIAKAARKGYELKTGVECEFFLIGPDGQRIADAADHQSKPCYDQSALMRRYDVITEICDSMLELGWAPYQNDHEDANGQFEMNWQYDDALITADRHAFFKYMVKSIAEKHGLRATFMPKPFANLTGNGCHVHVSLWERRQEPVRGRQRSARACPPLGYQFIGGVMHSARGARRHHQSDGQLLQAHQRAAYALRRDLVAEHGDLYRQQPHPHDPHSRTPGRFEFRLADGAANPYLLQAAMLVAGLDGIAQKRDPGKRLDIDMYAEGHKAKDAKKLPLNLLDALRALEQSERARATGLGDAVRLAYLKLKHAEWNDYARHLTEWERRTTLDC